MPRLRLFTSTLLVDRGELFPCLEETEVPAIQLRFDYAAESFRPARREATAGARDLEAEARACYLLESLGAVDLDCLGHYERIDDEADFVVAPDGDVHAVCAFGAFALPQLRALGWDVEVDPGYRWQVISQAPWYGGLKASPDGGDWFSLELGVEVDGQRVNLLPALIGLLEGMSSLRARRSSTRRCLVAPIDGHRYVALSPERAEALLEVLKELYGGECLEDGRIRLPMEEAPALAALDEVFHGRHSLSWRGSREAHDLALASAAPPPLEEAPRGLQAELRPYQRDGLAWLQHLHRHGAGGILADDMGLGKTLQTIGDLVMEHEKSETTLPSLIICPTSVLTNWKRELGRFAPSLRVLMLAGPDRHQRFAELPSVDVAITSYPLLTRDFDRLLRQRFHLLVLDEAQAIKNSSSQTHRSARALLADHRLCLSGTPLENNLGELWALFDFLMPGHLGDSDQFRQRFRTPIEQGAPGPLESLRRRVSPFILRRTKDEVLKELPPKTEMVRAVELAGAQRDLYESIRVAAHAEVRRTIAEKGLARSTITILDALLKLRQVCCDPRLVKMSAARRVRESAKLDTLLELLEQQRREKRRVLVFSQFTGMLALIAAALEERRIPFLTLTGETRDRQARIDAFSEGQADLFLISLKAGGTGLNLTRADTVIHVDPWWNPAAQAQATDRAHRFGQTRPVFVYSLIVAGSVEERMLRLQQQKRELADSILAGASRSAFSEREVDDLFGPLDEESELVQAALLRGGAAGGRPIPRLSPS